MQRTWCGGGVSRMQVFYPGITKITALDVNGREARIGNLPVPSILPITPQATAAAYHKIPCRGGSGPCQQMLRHQEFRHPGVYQMPSLGLLCVFVLPYPEGAYRFPVSRLAQHEPCRGPSIQLEAQSGFANGDAAQAARWSSNGKQRRGSGMMRQHLFTASPVHTLSREPQSSSAVEPANSKAMEARSAWAILDFWSLPGCHSRQNLTVDSGIVFASSETEGKSRAATPQRRNVATIPAFLDSQLRFHHDRMDRMAARSRSAWAADPCAGGGASLERWQGWGALAYHQHLFVD